MRAKNIWKALFFFWTGLIVYLCLFKAPSINSKWGFPHLDKCVHFTFYFVWMVLGFFSFEQYFESINRYKLYKLLLMLGFGFGLAIECTQMFIPNRGFEWMDVLANSIGLTLGLPFISVLKKGL